MSRPIKLTFLKAGLLTLVVDKSRVGYQKFGVPVAGAMDAESAKLANWLVGNDTNTSLIEINLVGPQIQFKSDCQIALTGADISPTLNGAPIEMYKTLSVAKGDILEFGEQLNGSRSYLAIRGSWKVVDWINNDSPKNSPTLKNLNSIEITSSGNTTPYRKAEKPTSKEQTLILHMMEGPEFDLLSDEVIKIMLNIKFELLPASNRMGYRLFPNLPPVGASIISSGVVPGTLQITEEGYPILLMKDAPATGGYMRVLNVMKEDISKLGQLKAGDSLKFKLD